MVRAALSACLASWPLLVARRRWARRQPGRCGDRAPAARERTNLTEVANYSVPRDHGRGQADHLLGPHPVAPASDEATPERMLAALLIEAQHAVALADCFAIADHQV
jgi:hypothetical protein